jgi:hypothetical protein
MIMASCAIAWRNQYNHTHKTILESPRTMLPDLENIKKIFVEKYNKKAKPTRPRLQESPRLLKHTCLGSAQMEAHLIKSQIGAALENFPPEKLKNSFCVHVGIKNLGSGLRQKPFFLTPSLAHKIFPL